MIFSEDAVNVIGSEESRASQQCVLIALLTIVFLLMEFGIIITSLYVYPIYI